MTLRKSIINPFPVNRYLGKTYFCDREQETNTLMNNITNGHSSCIIALRRIGKTGLIKHVLNQLPKNYIGVYIDILETENMAQFLNILASSILQQVPDKTTIGKAILKFISSLRPTLSFDPLNGMPQASFTVNNEEAKTNINAIFNFLEKHQSTIIIAIDEFQQILNYPEQNADAWLRSRIQQLNNIVFIFSGSQQHLMSELFASPKRPFYRSAQVIQLQKIEEKPYCAFIIQKFADGNIKITKKIVTQILDWTDRHTYYTQALCNRLFALQIKNLSEEDWKSEAQLLIKEQELMFFSFRSMLAKNQWKVLKALAQNGKTYKPTAQKFLKDYDLGSSATVLKAIKALLNSELIYKDYEANGDSYYAVYDLFFKRWAERL